MATSSPTWQLKYVGYAIAVAIILSSPVTSGQTARSAIERGGTFFLNLVAVDQPQPGTEPPEQPDPKPPDELEQPSVDQFNTTNQGDQTQFLGPDQVLNEARLISDNETLDRWEELTGLPVDDLRHPNTDPVVAAGDLEAS